MHRILLIEDEPSILMALEDDLRLEGYRVDSARDGPSGLSMAVAGGYDLIVLDIMLPRMDGFEVCGRLRRSGVTAPLLMLTAKSQEIDKVLGLELGADDYVTKPFSPRELLARVRALLRRAHSEPDSVGLVRFGEIEIDFRKFAATRRGEPLELTTREFDILKYLVERRDRAVRRSEILRDLWQDAGAVFPRTVDVHVANLRRKLEDDPAHPRWIVGVRGVGYRFGG